MKEIAIKVITSAFVALVTFGLSLWTGHDIRLSSGIGTGFFIFMVMIFQKSIRIKVAGTIMGFAALFVMYMH